MAGEYCVFCWRLLCWCQCGENQIPRTKLINDIGCPRCHRLAYVCNCDVKITKVEIEARYDAALQDKERVQRVEQ